jgi:hypothetical protein
MRQLGTVQAGIICLTPQNLTNYWIHFEAGALANRVFEETRVMTYLIGIKNPSALRPPLSIFHARIAADPVQTLKLVKDVNRATGSTVDPDRLKKRFEKFWPELKQALEEAKPDDDDEPPEREIRDMVEEMLGTVRSVGVDVARAVDLSTRANYLSQGFLPEFPSVDFGTPFPDTAPSGPGGPQGPVNWYTSGVDAAQRPIHPRARPTLAETIRAGAKTIDDKKKR